MTKPTIRSKDLTEPMTVLQYPKKLLEIIHTEHYINVYMKLIYDQSVKINEYN